MNGMRLMDGIVPNLVVEAAALRVSEHDEDVFVHRLQELARARNCPTGAYILSALSFSQDAQTYTPAPETNASTCPLVCLQISGPVPSKCAS